MQNFRAFLSAAVSSHRPFLLDGGTGTMLQARGLRPGDLPELWNLTRPDDILALHAAYLRAGASILSSNTFGANRLHFPSAASADAALPPLTDIIPAAISIARRAIAEADREGSAFVALDIGPSGKLLAPLGDLAFEDAVALFAEVVRIGARAGADLILLETFNDAYETKAAVLAAKEASDLPVIVSNTYDRDAHLLSGTPPEAMVPLLESLRVDAIGANCGLGPDLLLPVAQRLLAAARVPILISPNAGLPQLRDGRTTYPLDPARFTEQMMSIAALGPAILGGCCGTTPDHISALSSALSSAPPATPPAPDPTIAVATSWHHALPIGLPSAPPILIGERINPTGKPAFQAALRAGDLAPALREAVLQKDDGAQVLDVNVGVPGADEPALLLRLVSELQAVTELPLQIDTSDPAALAPALRIYNGKPLINSVNGKRESLEAVLPLVARYGGVLVALTLDEKGIPSDPADRLRIALRIRDAATEAGIPPSDLLFDPLAMAASADPAAPLATLESLRLLKAQGFKTSLGLSNISFGLPRRPLLNATFLSLAIQAGLDAAILNPHSAPILDALHAASALLRRDPSFSAYIPYALAHPAPLASGGAGGSPAAASSSGPLREGAVAQGATGGVPVPPPDNHQTTKLPNHQTTQSLYSAILSGLKLPAAEAARAALDPPDPVAPMDLINDTIIPALDAIGTAFEQKRAFLPQLLMAAEAAQAAFAVLQQHLLSTPSAAKRPRKYPIILATVQGDIHDIGKNILATLLRNYDYEVHDLGRDVPPADILDAVRRFHAPLVGLSALMTTTLPAMEDTIALLRRESPDTRIMVGGAVLTPDYASSIHADFYGRDAMSSVRYAESLLPQ